MQVKGRFDHFNINVTDLNIRMLPKENFRH